MTELVIEGLRASAGGTEILRGIDLTVRSGEVHAVMGPNGAGKSTLSHVLMGRPGYEVTGGSVTLDGRDLLGLPTWERVRAGLFLVMQYPTEVPGVSLVDTLSAAFAASGRDAAGMRARMAEEASRIGFDDRFLERPLNVDLSGGEKKRNETMQLGVLDPAFAILDELDSGLDIDALRACARRVEAATETGTGVLCITHYTRVLAELKADRVHILVRGEVRDSGGPELADRLEEEGYAAWTRPEDEAAATQTPRTIDPFGEGSFADQEPVPDDPFGPGPFAQG
ncbi:Fe-S cluster assembly ATPase SufC [Iamia majanohamensis]|uniref:Fe-S cluster assembly ATPase SufC n=1 Tax=Iamia majanohamensis TaxID=467976 RepID=A0AAE9Y448_9ACTN|nr:Fe-S cluster assembly ATPase SufC [Iamia majanohamensis]WCO65802.1 Fe-S cluster assembly ATPase SufC [Iamia majanohamensis]